MKTTKYTNKELVEIYKNLKTSAKILGFSSASDSEMIAEIELEAIKRHLNLIDGTVEETAERQKDEVITMKTKTYKAAVTNKETGKLEVITRDDYTSKKDFAHDLRVNGYAVRFISTPEKFDEDCENYYWKSEERKHARIVAKQHKSQPAKQTEVEETAEIETAKPETAETVEQTEEQHITNTETVKSENVPHKTKTILVGKDAYFYLKNEQKKQRGCKPIYDDEKNNRFWEKQVTKFDGKARLGDDSFGGGDGTFDGRW